MINRPTNNALKGHLNLSNGTAKSEKEKRKKRRVGYDENYFEKSDIFSYETMCSIILMHEMMRFRNMRLPYLICRSNTTETH